MTPQPLTLAKVRLTCIAAPSQWNAWDAAGQYYYLRYRFGRATVDSFKSPNYEEWPPTELGQLFTWTHPDREEYGNLCYHGDMTLREFCEHTGIRIADDADIRPFDWNED